jgi:hypothetical protein
MLNIRTQKHIRFAKLDRGDAWVIVAVLVEEIGNETIISEPKVVKIIQKNTLALSGSVQSHQFLLKAPTQLAQSQSESLVSPYFAYIFGSEKSNFITGLAARPPTFA